MNATSETNKSDEKKLISAYKSTRSHKNTLPTPWMTELNLDS